MPVEPVAAEPAIDVVETTVEPVLEVELRLEIEPVPEEPVQQAAEPEVAIADVVAEPAERVEPSAPESVTESASVALESTQPIPESPLEPAQSKPVD